MAITWLDPEFLWLLLPVTAYLFGFAWKNKARKGSRFLFCFRAWVGVLLILALSHPVSLQKFAKTKMLYAVDVSSSMGDLGLRQAWERLDQSLKEDSEREEKELWIFAQKPRRLSLPIDEETWMSEALALQKEAGEGSHYQALFEALKWRVASDETATLFLIGDGVETAGQLLQSQFWASVPKLQVQALPLAGARKAGVWLSHFGGKQESRQIRRGESLELEAEVQASGAGRLQVTLYENDRKVEARVLEVSGNHSQRLSWTVQPAHKGLYRYKVVVEGEGIPVLGGSREILQAVSGPLRVLWLDEELESADAALSRLPVSSSQMEVVQSSVDSLAPRLETWASFDAVVLAHVSADRLGTARMQGLKDYVERLGGGLLVLGGTQSFALGGYIGSPLESILPVTLQGKDQEEQQSSALALVIDRSGSMAGEKLEMAKAASLASAEILTNRDYLGVYAFDSEVHSLVPMLKLGARATLQKQIAALQSGGGTHLAPALKAAQDALLRVPAKSRHVIVLSDGQTTGEGYESLVTQMKGQGITLSTVSIGEGAHQAFLQTLANLGAGQAYTALELSQVTGFFTQDTLRHTGRMIKEGAVNTRLVKGNQMLAEWELWDAPPILGYVQTQFRPYVDRVLETSQGDPLLASWQVGAGRVSVFTSDASKRWCALWQSRWPKSSVLWAEVLRKTARSHDLEKEVTMSEVSLGDRSLIRVSFPPDGGSVDLGALMQRKELHATWMLSSHENAALGSEKGGDLPIRRVGVNDLEIELPTLENVSGWVAFQWGKNQKAYLVEKFSNVERENGWRDEAFLQEVTRRTGGRLLKTEEKEAPVAFEALRYTSWQFPLVLGALLGYLMELLFRRRARFRSFFKLQKQPHSEAVL